MKIKSRLLKRLDAGIAAAHAPVQRACMKAQRALLLARHGEMGEAREQLTLLHQLAFQHPHPEIGAWLHFAEGVMGYYTDFGSAAHERIQRAQDIARTAQVPALVALCSAWLMQLAYVRHELAPMVAHARDCDAQAAPDDHASRYRLCMVIGVSHQFAGEADKAQPWYARARAHAAAEGDDALLSALMFNMAEMRTAQVRREALSRPVSAGEGLILGADSVLHYDAAVGGSAMPGLTPILRAQILTVEGDFAQAQALFEAHLPAAMSSGLARLGSSLLADLAWCQLNNGRAEHALQQAREAEIELDPRCHVDDRAATHSRLAQVFAKLGDGPAAAAQAAQADALWQEFAVQQASWAQALAEAGLTPK